MNYTKIRFTDGERHTAGLVIPSTDLDRMTISEVSRLFPYSEAPKMHTFQRSEDYRTWEAAFSHQFA